MIWSILLGIKRHGIVGIVEEIHNAIFYPLGGMWFISACMIAALVISLLYNYKKLLIVIAIIGYIFALFSNTYYFLIENTFMQCFIDTYLKLFISGRNGLFVGIIQFGAGIALYKFQDKARRIKTYKVALGLALSYLILFLETAFAYGKNVRDDSSLFLIMPLLSIYIFELAKRIELPYDVKTSLNLRTFSKQLYFLHPFFNVYIGYILFYLTQNGLLQFGYVFLCCIFIMYYRKKIKNKWIIMVLPD